MWDKNWVDKFLPDLRIQDPLKTTIVSMLFVIISFFYFLTVGSIISPVVYPFIDRVTYSTPFTDKYIINQFFDSIVIIILTIIWLLVSLRAKIKFLVTIPYVGFLLLSGFALLSYLFEILLIISYPLLLTLIFINSKTKIKFLYFDNRLYIRYFGAGGIVLGISSLFVTILTFLYPDYHLPSVNYLYYIYLLSSTTTPVLLIIIAIYVPSIFILETVLKKTRNIITFPPLSFIGYNSISNINVAIFLLLIISLSSIISLLPHMFQFDQNGLLVSDDINNYKEMLEQVRQSESAHEFLYQIFMNQSNGDRPLSLTSFMLISSLLNTPSFAISISYLPLILGPLLILSVYFLTSQLTKKNQFTSLLASFLTITSFHISVGTYAGFYANWFALIFTYLSITFLMRYLIHGKRVDLVIFSVLLIMVLFSHATTWTLFTIIIISSLLLMLKFKSFYRIKILLLYFALVPSIVIDALRLVLTNSSGYLQDWTFAQHQDLGLHGIDSISSNLISSTQIYLGGLFGNSIIFFISIYFLTVSHWRNPNLLFLMIPFSLLILPIIFGDTEIQTRILYEIPFQIPIAIALTTLKNKYGNLIVFCICFWLLVIYIRVVTNLYFVPL